MYYGIFVFKIGGLDWMEDTNIRPLKMQQILPHHDIILIHNSVLWD